MFDLSSDWLPLALNASIRAILIAVIAGIALSVLRIRDANVRHRVWSGVLFGMLTLPILYCLLPAVPLPFELQAGWQNDWLLVLEEPFDATANSNSGSVMADSGAENPNRPALQVPEPSSFSDATPPIGTANVPSSESSFTNEQRLVDAGEALPTDSNVVEAAVAVPTVQPSSVIVRWLPTALMAGFVVWLFVMIALMLRTMVGIVATSVLLRRSQRLHADCVPDCCNGVMCPFERGTIRLMSSDEIRVPVTVGWWRPTVLLPATWTEWSTAKLEAVLAHETTHVVRRDFIVTVVAEVNRCVYWFHPMAWWLRRNLADLAEEACDDAAIGLTGNPAGYARHLLEVAAALTHGPGRIVQPGMSMARESNVESRIAAILDFGRPLSRQLTWKALAVLLLITVPVIALSAALQPSGPSSDVATAAVASADESSSADQRRGVPPIDGLHIHGQVVDTNKRGLATAKVRLYRTKGSGYYAANPVSTLIEDLSVDSDGRFDTLVSHNKLPQEDGDKQWKNKDWLMLVVSAPGQIYITHSFPEYGETEPLTLGLRKAAPIQGRLLSLEGLPVSGVTVSVVGCVRADGGKLDAWLAKLADKPHEMETENELMFDDGPAQDRFPAKRDLKIPIPAVPVVVSDNRGEFQLDGFGPDDLVLVELSGGGVVKSTLHVLGRDLQGKGIIAGHVSNLSRMGSYHGRNFSFVTQPAVPVFGVVRDMETKEPLVGVDVAIGHVAGRSFSHTGYEVVTTDQQGRYRIEGLPAVPKGSRRRDRNSLSIRPGARPYIENDSWAIPPRDGLDPIEFNMELRRAVLARGRLTNKNTGEPIQALIYYSPFRTNDHCADYPHFADGSTMMLGNDSRYRTDKDGYFSVPVIEGRGVIAAKALDGNYCTQYGVQDIPEFKDGVYKDGNTVTSDHIGPSIFHSLKAIDVEVGVKNFDVEMQVDPGLSLMARFIDQNGNPLSNVEVSGAPAYRGWVKTDTDSTPINGLVVGQVRPLLATLDGPNRISRLIQLTPEEGQKEFTIQLFKRTVLTGRLIGSDGQPLANQSLEDRHQNDPDFMNSLRPNPVTDKDGRFKMYLHVGAKYRVVGYREKFFTLVKDLDVSKPQRIDLGDLIVDSDADDWATIKAKREPIVKDREPYIAASALAPAALSAPSNASQKPVVQAAGEASDTDLIFKGIVTDPAGKPFAGAKVYLIYWDHGNRRADPDEPPLAVSGSDGSFKFTIDAADPANGPMPGAGQVVAVAKGYALAHVISTRLETTGKLLESWPSSQREWIEKEIAKYSGRVELKEDASVRGRIVDSEGQPVVGATVRVQEVSEGVGGSLKEWETATQLEKADYYSSREKLRHLFNGFTRSHLAVPSVQTNADGWFELSGIGLNRIAEVVISGPAIASSVVNVRANSGETIRLMEQWPEKNLGTRTYYANGFTHVAAPSQVVTGRITDRSTGRPLANCLIQAERLSSQRIGGRTTVGYIRTRTDVDGRYTLRGLPLGKCDVVVIPSGTEPFVPVEFGVAAKQPSVTSERNVELVRGVLVEGRVTDSRTGKPIAGRLEYGVFSTNEFVKGKDRLRLASMRHYYRSGPDGRFRIPVLPGPGVLGFNADDHQSYQRAKWTPQPNMPNRSNNADSLDTRPSLIYAGNFHYVAGIDPASGLQSMSLDFELTSGINISGTVERPDGSKVGGCAIYGESIPGGWYRYPGIAGSERGFTVQGYQPKRPQRVIAWLEDEQLIGTIFLKGKQPESVTITLSQAGQLKGRLVDEDGEPVVGVQIANGHTANDSFAKGSGDPGLRGEFPDDSQTKRKLVTDEDGRFVIPGLLPGLAYTGQARGVAKIYIKKFHGHFADLFKDVVVAAGETKDLGNVILQEQKD